MIGVAYGKFRRCAQIWQKACDHKKRILWPVFGKNKIFRTRLFHFCPSFFSIFGLSLFFWDSLTFYFYFFFDIFSSLRSKKEVSTKNMSLNKWKVWPVENSEDVLKIDKKLLTTKRGSCDQFLTKIKFSDLSNAEDGRIQKIFWSILIYGTSKSEFVCEN